MDGKIVTLDVDPVAPISRIKEVLKERLRLPSKLQRLIFDGKELSDDKSLADYNIQKESTLDLIDSRKAPANTK